MASPITPPPIHGCAHSGVGSSCNRGTDGYLARCIPPQADSRLPHQQHTSVPVSPSTGHTQFSDNSWNLLIGLRQHKTRGPAAATAAAAAAPPSSHSANVTTWSSACAGQMGATNTTISCVITNAPLGHDSTGTKLLVPGRSTACQVHGSSSSVGRYPRNRCRPNGKQTTLVRVYVCKQTDRSVNHVPLMHACVPNSGHVVGLATQTGGMRARSTTYMVGQPWGCVCHWIPYTDSSWGVKSRSSHVPLLPPGALANATTITQKGRHPVGCQPGQHVQQYYTYKGCACCTPPLPHPLRACNCSQGWQSGVALTNDGGGCAHVC
jgi:hypothetical protein